MFNILKYEYKYLRSKYKNKKQFYLKLVSSVNLILSFLFSFYFSMGYFNNLKLNIYLRKHILIILFLLIVVKVIFQKELFSYYKPLLLLPISKVKLLIYIVIRNYINTFNLLVLGFLTGFWYTNIYASGIYDMPIYWILLLYIIHFVFSTGITLSVSILSKSKLKDSVTIFVELILIVATSVLFQHNLMEIALLSNTNYLIIISLLSILLLLILRSSYPIFYIEQSDFKLECRYNFNSNLFNQNYFMQIHNKLIFRNKLFKGFLLQEIIAIAFSLNLLFRINFQKFNQHPLIISFFLFFITTVLCGYFFVVPFGNNIFGFESNLLKLLFLNLANIKLYIESKIKILNIYFTCFFLFSLIFIFFLPNFLFLFLISVWIYFLGVLTFFLVLQSIKSFKIVYPNINFMQNVQNVKFNRWYLIAPVITPLILLLVLVDYLNYELAFYIFDIIVLSVGLLGMLFRKREINFLFLLFLRNKYKFIS